MSEKELRVFIIGGAPEDEHTESLIDGADFCALAPNSKLEIGDRIDTGPNHWGVLQVVRNESARIAICRPITEVDA